MNGAAFLGSLCHEATNVPVDISGCAKSGTIEVRSESRMLLETTAMTDIRDETEEFQSSSFPGSIFEPGSSFNPTFLVVVDGAFASLFAVLVALAVLTQGNIHLIFLTFIELALWASVKWYVISRLDSRRHRADADASLGSYMSGKRRKTVTARLPVA